MSYGNCIFSLPNESTGRYCCHPDAGVCMYVGVTLFKVLRQSFYVVGKALSG